MQEVGWGVGLAVFFFSVKKFSPPFFVCAAITLKVCINIYLDVI